MAINYHYLMNLPPLVVHQRYTARDTILYALGVGAGLGAANDPHYLHLVYEKDLAALPTMATVLAYPGFWTKERPILHGLASFGVAGLAFAGGPGGAGSGRLRRVIRDGRVD
jgi:hypothetical protein